VGGRLVAGPAFGDRQYKAELFDIAVGADSGAHQLGSADLKIAEKVGVVDDTAGIGIAVEYSDRGGKNMFRHEALT